MLAIIPARSGSKRLINKNKLPLNGIPLIVYSIEAALNCPLITTIIVTTDDEDIIKICSDFNVEIDVRSTTLSSDTSCIWDTCNTILKNREFKELDFILLQPTSPLRTSIHIEEAIDKFKSTPIDYLVSVCNYSKPIIWAKETNEDKLKPVFSSEMLNELSNKEIVHPNGAIYCIRSKHIQTNKNLLNTGFYLMDKEDSVDIDTKLDFLLAEVLIQKRNK